MSLGFLPKFFVYPRLFYKESLVEGFTSKLEPLIYLHELYLNRSLDVNSESRETTETRHTQKAAPS